MMTTLSSREFSRNIGGAKMAARQGPVFIMDRGRPTHVLVTIEDYRKLAGSGMSLLDALAQTGEAADFDFDPPRLSGPLHRPADLS